MVTSGTLTGPSAPTGFSLAGQFDWDKFSGTYPTGSNNNGYTMSYRVLPNTTAFNLPPASSIPQWQAWGALYFRPTRAISSVSVAGLVRAVNYQSQSVTVSASGVAGPVIVFGGVGAAPSAGGDVFSLSASPGFNGSVESQATNQSAGYVAAYRLYGLGSTADNVVVTNTDTNGGGYKGVSGFYLTVR